MKKVPPGPGATAEGSKRFDCVAGASLLATPDAPVPATRTSMADSVLEDPEELLAETNDSKEAVSWFEMGGPKTMRNAIIQANATHVKGKMPTKPPREPLVAPLQMPRGSTGEKDTTATRSESRTSLPPRLGHRIVSRWEPVAKRFS